MDTNGTSANPLNNPNLIVPPGTSSPKVFDLSSVNSLNQSNKGNQFKKKPFIIGIISVLLIALATGSIFYITQTSKPNAPATTTQTRATTSGGYTEGSVNHVVCNGDTHQKLSTRMVVHHFSSKEEYDKIKNGTHEDALGLVGMAPEGGCNINNNYCTDGTSCTTGNDNHAYCDATAPIPDCSVAQLDCINGAQGGSVMFNPNGCGSTSPPPPPPTTQSIKCTRIDQTPPDTRIIPGEKIKLTNSTSGSTGTWESTWSVTSDGAKKGTFENINYNGTYWTAPATLNASQTWTFNVKIKDKNGSIDNTGCTSTVSFTTTAQTYTHKVCNADKACVSVACNPATTDCSSSTDCKTAADCETTTYKFNTCENNSCVSKDCPNPNVSCSQSDDCKNDNDCKSAPSHKVCQNNACVTIDGAGTDNCSNDSACQSNPTHKTCQNNACVTIDGAGSDSCTSDAMCQPEATPPPIPESGNTLMTVGTIIVGAIAILGGIFLAI